MGHVLHCGINLTTCKNPLLSHTSHHNSPTQKPKRKNLTSTFVVQNIPPSLTNNNNQSATIFPSQKQEAPTTTPNTNNPCKFFATCSPGLEQVVAAELSCPMIGALGVREGKGGVYFQGTMTTGYMANLWLRSAIRVLHELSYGELSRKDRDCVYTFIRESVDWPTYIASCTTIDNRTGFKKWNFRSFAVQSRVWDCTQVSNSMSASVRAKDAICDAIRDACNNRKPSPPEEGAAMSDVPLFLSLYKNRAIIYRDMSGISLHRRGYRSAMHRASLNEALAAGLLTMAGFNSRVPGFGVVNKNGMDDVVLLDPMCGSGTFLIEAILMASNRAPGLTRTHWPFKSWHDYDAVSWNDCCKSATSAATEVPNRLKILGNDKHEGALSLCIRDAEAAGVKDSLELTCKDCRDYVPSFHPSLVIVNPPWGFRLGNSRENENEDVISTWQALGQFSKQNCNNADMYVFSGEQSLSRLLRLKADRKWPISMGGLECRLLHYFVLPPKPDSLKQDRNSFLRNSLVQ